MDINRIEKIFCEAVTIGHSKEYFVMVANPASENPMAYVFTPEHAKRLLQYLETQLSEFEIKYSKKIDAKWEPGIQSPIQTSDLLKPGNDDSKGQSGKKR